MVSLNDLNEKFCVGAAEIWYIYNIDGKNAFSQKKPRRYHPTKQGIMRTIRSIDGSEYLLIMDCDGYGLTQEMLDMGYHVHRRMQEKPLLKPSASKGFQMGWKVIFPQTPPEHVCVDYLQLLAWTIYVELELEQFDINFGPPKKVEPPYFDTSMYQHNRKIRGFCTRYNGLYSVPIKPGDDMDTVNWRMLLWKEPFDYEMGTIIFDKGMLTSEPMPWGAAADRQEVPNANIYRVGGPHKDTLRKLPKYLRNVTLYRGDISHKTKLFLVWYLMRMGYDDDYIIDYIWNMAKWSDLDNYKLTVTQIQSARRTFNKAEAESGAFSFPEFIYDD